MSNPPKPYKLLEVTGIELEYMIVDRDTLRVLPIVDKLFEDVTGRITGDVERGAVEWSNELVAHVLELKTAKPTKKIPPFRAKFSKEVKVINAVLAKRNAMLLPGAAHRTLEDQHNNHRHGCSPRASAANIETDRRGDGPGCPTTDRSTWAC